MLEFTKCITKFVTTAASKKDFNRPHFPQFSTCFIEGDPIARTTSAKLLGLTINDKLIWNDHTEEIV